jgi:hypothetical protein
MSIRRGDADRRLRPKSFGATTLRIAPPCPIISAEPAAGCAGTTAFVRRGRQQALSERILRSRGRALCLAAMGLAASVGAYVGRAIGMRTAFLLRRFELE